MGRIHGELIPRVESFCDRALDVAEEIEEQRRFRRIVDQLAGSGTSVGANLAEADEAVSRKDFCKSLSTSLKELSETQYWFRLNARRSWIPAVRLHPLQAEAAELRKIFGKMLSLARTGKD